MTSSRRQPNSVAALRTALEYIRDEAHRLGLSDVVRALDDALTLVGRELDRIEEGEDRSRDG